MTTIKDIANKMGVSVSTVSKGLNGGSDISEEIRRQVLDTAVEMGYRPKHSKTPENRKLGIMIKRMKYQNPEDFGYELVLGFKQIAMKENWNVEVIEVTEEMQAKESYDPFVLKKGLSGAFLLGFSLIDLWMKEIHVTTMPTVMLDNRIPFNKNVCDVGTDSEEGMMLAVRHLHKLGHREIALLNGYSDSLISFDREAGFRKAMAEMELCVKPEQMGEGHFISETSESYLDAFLKCGATAYVCSSDVLAAGVVSAAKRAGLRVPEDISVVGYDDVSAASCDPPLTTIRQERNVLGRLAYMNLYSLINGIAVCRSLLRPTLIDRSSCAAAK